jgi:hypothetical protein
MFEDFKEKIRESNHLENRSSSSLPSEVEAELRAEGLDPETATLKELFPEELDQDGNDLSLLSGLELEIWTNCWRTRQYLAAKYPLPNQLQAHESNKAPQINVAAVREDPKGNEFFESLRKVKAIYDKVHILQKHATAFEKVCLRYYGHISYNWVHAPDVARFRENLTDLDLFEAVDAYFKICRKYHAPTQEEPFCFLSEKQRLDIKLEGDMLKRTGNYSENEIHISNLEAFQ